MHCSIGGEQAPRNGPRNRHGLDRAMPLPVHAPKRQPASAYHARSSYAIGVTRIAQQQAVCRALTGAQCWRLEKTAGHIASNLGIEAEDIGYAPFDQRGGLGRVHQLFGAVPPKVIDELNRECAA